VKNQQGQTPLETEAANDFSKVDDRLMVCSEKALLAEINLRNVTLLDINFFVPGMLSSEGLTDKVLVRKYELMNVLYELFNTPVVSVGLAVQRLSPSTRLELREILINVLRGNLSEEYFQHILAAFDNEEGSYHYPQLFAYLSKNADERLMLSFIKWSAKNLLVDHHYSRAVKTYLKSHPRSIWRNKGARKELQEISSLRKLVKEVQSETANPFVKLFNRYGVQLSVVLLTIIVAGGGLYFGYDLLTGETEKAAFSKSSRSAAAGVEDTEKAEPLSIEPFKRWGAENPYVFNVNGQQQRIAFGKVNPVGGKSLVLLDSQNIETVFDLVVDSEITPFDEQGVLKEGFTFYHTGYDFDDNGIEEIVIMVLNQTFESFVWVYSPISENGSIGLRAELAVRGMSDAKLADNTVNLLGDKGQSETYAYIDQQFVKQ
jgi:hypothetical protein